MAGIKRLTWFHDQCVVYQLHSHHCRYLSVTVIERRRLTQEWLISVTGVTSVLWSQFLWTKHSLPTSVEGRSSAIRSWALEWTRTTGSLTFFCGTSCFLTKLFLEAFFFGNNPWSGNFRTRWPCLFLHKVWQDVQYPSWLGSPCSEISFRKETLCLRTVQQNFWSWSQSESASSRSYGREDLWVQAVREDLQTVIYTLDPPLDPLGHSAIPMSILWQKIPSKEWHEKAHLHPYRYVCYAFPCTLLL